MTGSYFLAANLGCLGRNLGLLRPGQPHVLHHHRMAGQVLPQQSHLPCTWGLRDYPAPWTALWSSLHAKPRLVPRDLTLSWMQPEEPKTLVAILQEVQYLFQCLGKVGRCRVPGSVALRDPATASCGLYLDYLRMGCTT